MSVALLDRPFESREIARFNEAGPYYSSYPPLGRWTMPLGSAAYRRALADWLRTEPGAPVYLYVHVPYCAKLCWYCIC
ncbi:MAG: coproporphyrinogen III oxidase, partial [Alphaproteobacteria bacterium]|nr:coproporphyrinogen III oxidase [Alphaproteobacteria bacterium]